MPHKDIQALINSYNALSSHKDLPKQLKDALSSHKVTKSPLGKGLKLIKACLKPSRPKSTDYEIVMAYNALDETEMDQLPFLVDFAHSELIKGCQLLEELHLFSEYNFQLFIEDHRLSFISFLKSLERFKSLGFLERNHPSAQKNYVLFARHWKPELILKLLERLHVEGLLVDDFAQKFFESIVQPDKAQKFDNLLHTLHSFNLLCGSLAKENLKLAVLADFNNLHTVLASQEAISLMMGSHGVDNYRVIASHASPEKIVSGLFALKDFGLLHGRFANNNRELMAKHKDPHAVGKVLRLLSPSCENAQDYFHFLIMNSSILFHPQVKDLWAMITQIQPQQRKSLIELCAHPEDVDVSLVDHYLKNLLPILEPVGESVISTSPSSFFRATSLAAITKEAVSSSGLVCL